MFEKRRTKPHKYKLLLHHGGEISSKPQSNFQNVPITRVMNYNFSIIVFAIYYLSITVLYFIPLFLVKKTLKQHILIITLQLKTGLFNVSHLILSESLCFRSGKKEKNTGVLDKISNSDNPDR